ncbi:cyclin-D5-3 isoform X2 [Oryza brachyantha]|uniref:cyclin-D5-3 isoform X2 n=1 Tax=Oryza brachyantha TaxID=4533 RepID=UPI00077615DA|nr:cyclin-D5-3 isoform X2 [Oryza brachyantha]
MGDASASTSAPATPTSTLICREDGSDLFSAGADDGGGGEGAGLSVAGDEHLLLVEPDDEYLALMLSRERCAGGDVGERGEEVTEEWMKSARAGCVGWIVKANAGFRFSWKTAYVAVTYLDRFLARRRVDRGKEWALHLLSVACLSLAAKVEERRPPRLPEFRVDQYDFDCASILRMELLVLRTLKWQMITGTPFSYLSCITAKFRHDERKAIVLRAIECIFASIRVMSTVEYQPSTIAVAAILIAQNKETSPNLDELKVILGSSWQQLDAGHVCSCYKMMIQEDRSMQSTTEVASSGVSVAHIGGSEDGSMADVNNATTLAATPDNKRKS